MGVGTILLIIIIILALSLLFRAVTGIIKLLLVASIIILIVLGIVSLASDFGWVPGQKITGLAVKEDEDQKSIKDKTVEGIRKKIKDYIERKRNG